MPTPEALMTALLVEQQQVHCCCAHACASGRVFCVPATLTLHEATASARFADRDGQGSRSRQAAADVLPPDVPRPPA